VFRLKRATVCASRLKPEWRACQMQHQGDGVRVASSAYVRIFLALLMTLARSFSQRLPPSMHDRVVWLQFGGKVPQILIYLKLFKIQAFIGRAVPFKVVRFELQFRMGILADLIDANSFLGDHGGHPSTLRR